jgi:uncharacterized protein (DUF1501 family)
MTVKEMISRRSFLKRCSGHAFGVTVASTLADLRLINNVMAQGPQINDYKALVCLFLNGGNDSGNILVPTSGAPDSATRAAYDNYVAQRGGQFNTDNTLGGLGLLPADYTGTLPRVVPISVQNNAYDFDFGVHSSFASNYSNGVPQDGIAKLFANGRAAFINNLGTLVEPITQAQYKAGTRRRPPQLFSHNDQVVQWQTSVPDQIVRTGWGGRIADREYIRNSNAGSQISMSISIAGNNTWEVGDIVNQYQVTTDGGVALNSTSGTDIYNASRLQAMNELVAIGRTNLNEKDHADILNRAINNVSVLSNALTSADAGNNGAIRYGTSTTAGFRDYFPNTSLSNQMRMVARIINARGAQHLGMKRQIFFVSIGGFDTHTSQRDAHANNLLKPMSDAVWAFYRALDDMGMSSNVTTFTISDFGRTFKNNNIGLIAGSDHGWGSTQMVFGGAVQGGRLYGKYPVLRVNGPDDTSDGRWIPTASVDEYAATLARWFGVTENDLDVIFPNLNRFESRNMGFM